MMHIVKRILVPLLLASPLMLQAADKPTVTCMDGATSKGGQGACSGHGGIRKEDAVPPPGATARCKDGSYYLQKEHKGACGGHGGVADWLDKK